MRSLCHCLWRSLFCTSGNRVEDVKHDFLLSNKKGGVLTKTAFSKALHKITKELLGVSFGSRLIRILAATDMKDEIDKVAELSNKMLHSAGSKQTKQYTRNLNEK